eukprot:jgi/Mesvir1/26649/Mv20438-RA.1
MVGVALFLATRLSGGVPLSALETSAVPLDIALGNGRPSVVEFYADWCEVCREMAPDVFALEKQYGDKVNWVMLNIDNPKWDPELEEYRVDGIPHFVFLDDHAQAKAEMIGRLPKGPGPARADQGPLVPPQPTGKVLARATRTDAARDPDLCDTIA